MTLMWTLGVLLGAPFLAALISLLIRAARISEMVNLLASVLCLLAAIALPFRSDLPALFLNGYLIVDTLGAWVVLCVAIVYLLASIYAVGYMRHGEEDQRLPVFYSLLALFALSMFVAPLMNNAGVYWIAVELTTLVSTFLVGFERNAESMEAAWKYIIVVSSGISLALLGTSLLYWGGTFVAGQTYTMTWGALEQMAPSLPPVLLQLGFLLALIGYGTKVGLAPMHTWLPDAHSEGPAPVSALLSGALLNTAMVGIVRLLAVVDQAGRGRIPHLALVSLGMLSLLVGALFIVRQKQIKRLMAYSSIEHMGILALGFGFGGSVGVAGALYHMLNHSLCKPLLFFGAGTAIHTYRTRSIRRMRGVWQALPWTGSLWLLGAVAITGAPPFGLFQSEVAILKAGWDRGYGVVVTAMLVLLIVIFVGFLNHFRLMYLRPGRIERVDTPSAMGWRIVPMAIPVVGLLVLGIYWPPAWRTLFSSMAHMLGAAP